MGFAFLHVRIDWETNVTAAKVLCNREVTFGVIGKDGLLMAWIFVHFAAEADLESLPQLPLEFLVIHGRVEQGDVLVVVAGTAGREWQSPDAGDILQALVVDPRNLLSRRR